MIEQSMSNNCVTIYINIKHYIVVKQSDLTLSILPIINH